MNLKHHIGLKIEMPLEIWFDREFMQHHVGTSSLPDHLLESRQRIEEAIDFFTSDNLTKAWQELDYMLDVIGITKFALC